MKGKGEYVLDDFFRVQTTVVLPGNRQATVRTLSEPEVQSRDQQAALAALRRRRLLDQAEGEERLLLQEEIAQLPLAQVIDVLGIYRQNRMALELRVQSNPETIILPDEASPQEREQVLIQREAALKSWLEQITRQSTEAGETERARWREQDEATVRAEMLQQRIEIEAQIAYGHCFENYTLYYGVQRGRGKRWFASPEETEQLASVGRNQLLAAYNEVSGVDPWDMQNFFGTDGSTAASVS